MPLRVSEAALLAHAVRRAAQRYRATILVAEDSDDSREMLQILLQSKGFSVLSAGDGLEAVDVALHELPDLILIDLRLPGQDGLSVTRELRLHPEFDSVAIIMISGYDCPRYRQAALNAGCNDYLMKPFDFGRLDQILAEMIPARFLHARTA